MAGNSCVIQFGPDSPPRKRGKYTKYTLPEKRSILAELEHTSFRQVSAKHHVALSTIATWKKALSKSGDDTSRSQSYRKPTLGRPLTYSKETDQKILSWVLRQRDLQLPVSHSSLIAYATGQIEKETSAFKASSGWIRQFMRRNNLSTRMKTSLSQKLPADLEVRLATFQQHLREITDEMEFDKKMIINMDEVPMYFDLVPRRTLHVKGEKDVRIITTGGEKRHFTVVLAATASGDKLPPMMIFKGKRPTDLCVPDGCQIRVNPKGWMTEELMLDWLEVILRPYTERRPSLLVMDSFSAHMAASVEARCSKLSVTTAIIPGGCTSHAQPLDVGVNKPFKDRLRRRWADSICSKVSETKQAPRTTKQEVVDWVTNAWASLPADLISKSFSATGISQVLDGSAENQRIIAEFFDSDDDQEEFLGFEDEATTVDSEDPFLED